MRIATLLVYPIYFRALRLLGKRASFSFLGMLLVVLASCNNTPRNVPFPEKEVSLVKPATAKLTFSEPVKLDWVTISQDSVKSAKIEKFDFDKLPSKPFDTGQGKPLSKPLTEIKFSIEQFADSTFDLEAIPAEKLRYKTMLLGEPKRVKSGMPRLKDGAWEGLLLFGFDQGLPGSVVRSLMEDRNGAVWIGTENGLCHFDGEFLEIYSIEQGLVNPWVIGTIEEDMGQIA